MNKLLCLIFALFIGVSSVFAGQNAGSSEKYIQQTLSQRDIEKPETNLDYNYLDKINSVQIPLVVCKKISTGGKDKAYEGEEIDFVVEQNVYYKRKLLIKKGTPVKGKVKIMTTRGFAGIPAEMIAGDFQIDGIDKNNLDEIKVKGFNATIWITPVKIAVTFIPFVGTLTNFAIGGNAVFNPNKTYYLQYYPEKI